MTDNENDMELNSEIGGQIITDITQETEEVEPDDTEEKKVIPGKRLTRTLLFCGRFYFDTLDITVKFRKETLYEFDFSKM